MIQYITNVSVTIVTYAKMFSDSLRKRMVVGCWVVDRAVVF